MRKTIALVLAAMTLMLLVSAALSESQGTEMYVYTKNGKPLLVRSSMNAADDGNVIGSLAYGQRIIIYGHKDGWAMLDYGNRTGYVMYRYLVKQKPAPYNADAAQQKPANEFTTKNATTVSQMNTLTASAKTVTPYTVTVRPTRASGWVYLRWFPSKNAQAMATFGGNYELTVIAELKDWYQVTDPATGMVGFIYKSYVQ